MNDTHPTAEQLDRYRRRTAPPADTLAVDAHIATCDRCLALVRPAGERHLHYDDLEAVVDGRASMSDRKLVERHTAACTACANELVDLRRMRDAMAADGGRASRPPAGWKPALRLAAAAAIAAIVFAAAWLWMQREPQPAPSRPRPPIARRKVIERAPVPEPQQIALQRPAILNALVHEPGVLRGAADPVAIDLQKPLGTVVLDDRPRFQWSPVRGARSYDIAVADAETGTVAATGSTAETAWQPDAPLPRGRTYMWQVTVRTGERSLPALFHVAPRAEAEGATPLNRGVALANLGALDDAERELERAIKDGDARAADVLAQVRSWRAR
jgi:anti-sigma factor RsiW